MSIVTKEITIKDKKVTGVEIDLPGAPLVLAKGAGGFVMCGYLNIEGVEKLGQKAAVVRGVKTVEDLLAGPVVSLSSAARACGVSEGISGREALEKMVL